MASDDANRPGTSGKGPSREADLSDRLRRLEQRLGPVKGPDAAPDTQNGPDGGNSEGLGKAMRLSSEFIAGIVAGFGIGWGVDRLFGTAPWGMIVFFLLGFLAGVVNVMRSAGMTGSSPFRAKRD